MWVLLPENFQNGYFFQGGVCKPQGCQISNMEMINQMTKTIPNGHKIYQIATKYTKWPQNIPNGNKIHQNMVKTWL
jgi:hypothetical protein